MLPVAVAIKTGGLTFSMWRDSLRLMRVVTRLSPERSLSPGPSVETPRRQSERS
jgi:hypothetical protein